MHANYTIYFGCCKLQNEILKQAKNKTTSSNELVDTFVLPSDVLKGKFSIQNVFILILINYIIGHCDR